MSWTEEDEWWFCSVSPWQASTLLVSDSFLPSRTLNNKLPASTFCPSVCTLTFSSLRLSPCVCVLVWLIVFLCYKYLSRNETLAAFCGVKHTPAHTHTVSFRQYPLKYYRAGTCYKPLNIRPNPFRECQFHSWDVKHLHRKVTTFQWKPISLRCRIGWQWMLLLLLK